MSERWSYLKPHIKNGRAPVTPAEVIGELDERKARHARRLSDEELAAKAKRAD